MAGFASNFTNLNSHLLYHLCVQVPVCPLNNPFIGLHRHAELLARNKRGWICRNGWSLHLPELEPEFRILSFLAVISLHR